MAWAGIGLADDHGRAAPGTLGVVAQVAFTGQPAVGHVGGVGAEIEPMLEGLVAQAQGLEQVRKQRGHGAGLVSELLTFENNSR